MTLEQAAEIREHLIAELNHNGFSDVVTEVNTRLEEDFQEEDFNRSPQSLLIFFLREGIEVIENLSNENFPELLSRLNKISEGKIEAVNVELLNGSEERVFYDLRELPSYQEISSTFRHILNEILEEN